MSRVGLTLGSGVLTACLVVWGCAEAPQPSDPVRQIESDQANDRMVAIVELTQRAEAGTDKEMVIPLLVDRLDDDDDAVRMYAIHGLDRLTGTRLGYRYSDPAIIRTEAVDRWRDYVKDRASAGSPSDEPSAGEQG